MAASLWRNRSLITTMIKCEVIRRHQKLLYDSVEQIAKSAFFDFAIAQSIFRHCGQNLLGKHLAAISNALKFNGALIATFIPGDVDPHQTGWVYPDCVAYNLNSMRTIARTHGFNFLPLDWLIPGRAGRYLPNQASTYLGSRIVL